MRKIKCLLVCLCFFSAGRTQSINNAGFESDSLHAWFAWHLSGTSPWYAWNPSGTSTIISGNAHSGAHAVYAWGGETSIEQLISNLEPNTTYIFEGWIKVNTAGQSAMLGVKNYGNTAVTASATTITYSKYQVSFTTGATNTQATVFFYKPDAGAAYGDDFNLVIQSPNLLINPAFATGSLFPWYSWQPAGQSTVKSESAGGGAYAVYQSGGETSVEQVITGLHPHTTYTFEGWVRVGAPGESVILGVKNYKATEVVVRDTGYAKYQTSFTTGDTVTQAIVFLYKSNTGSAYGRDFNVFTLSVGSPGNTTYYIDAIGGRDANDGKSPALAWQSLNKVNNTIFNAGDSILFKYDGVWVGSLSPKGSGSAGRPIVIGRYGGSSTRPIFNGNGALRVVYLSNQQYWEITDLEITNTARAGQKKRGIEVENRDRGKLTHIYIRGNYIHDVLGDNTKDENGSMGIMVVARKGSSPVLSWFDSLKIENNNVKSVNRTGIGTASEWGCRPSVGCTDGSGYVAHTHVEIRNNYVENAGGDGIVPSNTLYGIIEYNLVNGANVNSGTPNAGIWCWNGDHNLFQFNEVFNVRSTNDGQGYDVDYGQDGTIFQYNYSHDNEGGFMLICSGVPGGNNNAIIRYNISQYDRHLLFALHGPVSNVQIYNNTVFLPAGSTTIPVSVSSWNGLPVSAYFHNNIFYFAGAGKWRGWSNMATSVFDHNLVFGNASGMPAGQNNLTSDPQLVSPGGGTAGKLVNGVISFGNVEGYQLTSGSPAIGAGKVLPNNGGRDYWNNPVLVDKTPHIGAYNGAGVVMQPTFVLSDEQFPVSTIDDSVTVVEIGDVKVSKREFMWRMDGFRSACFDFFLQHHDAFYTDKDFWDRAYEGRTPLHWIKDKTLGALKSEIGKIRQLQQLGLLKGYHHGQFLAAWAKENERRKWLVEDGVAIYGPQRFDANSYLAYLLSNALLEARRILPFDNPVTEMGILAYDDPSKAFVKVNAAVWDALPFR